LIAIAYLSAILSKSEFKRVKKFSAADLDRDPQDLYKDFLLRHEKGFSIDSDEGKRRFVHFQRRLAHVKSRNKELTTYKLEINHLSDLSDEEFAAMNGLKPPQINQFIQIEKAKNTLKKTILKKISKSAITVKDYPAVNWTSLYNAPRDQGNCGCCWAFSTAGLIEGYLSQTGQKNYLSPQYLINCDRADNGCNGGWYQNSLTYVQANGLALDTAVPYSAVQNVCTTLPSVTGTIIAGFNFCTNFSVLSPCTESIVYSFLSVGPVGIGIDGNTQDIMSYSGGIFTGACVAMNHAVLLVGYGYDQTTNLNYWIVRNSWSINWGEYGYIRIARNINNNNSCFVTHSAFVPKLA